MELTMLLAQDSIRKWSDLISTASLPLDSGKRISTLCQTFCKILSLRLPELSFSFPRIVQYTYKYKYIRNNWIHWKWGVGLAISEIRTCIPKECCSLVRWCSLKIACFMIKFIRHSAEEPLWKIQFCHLLFQRNCPQNIKTVTVVYLNISFVFIGNWRSRPL